MNFRWLAGHYNGDESRFRRGALGSLKFAAPIISTDATGRTHRIVIPFGVTVNLVIASSFFRFANSTGVALAKTSASIPITVQPGQQPPTVHW